jgi:RNA polymerase sigma factor (sigma-70 family)
MSETELIEKPVEAEAEGQPFEVLLTYRAQHARLKDAVIEFGGIEALAQEIGVNKSVLSNWVNLRCVPSYCSKRKKGRGRNWERSRRAVLRLCEICKCSAKDLFPDFLQSDEFRALPKTAEVRKEITYVGLEYAAKAVAALPAPEDVTDYDDLKDKIRAVLKSLTTRERKIIKLCYGLGEDSQSYTFEEIARMFKMTRERVRQIQLKALAKIREPVRRNQLRPFVNPEK